MAGIGIGKCVFGPGRQARLNARKDGCVVDYETFFQYAQTIFNMKNSFLCIAKYLLAFFCFSPGSYHEKLSDFRSLFARAFSANSNWSNSLSLSVVCSTNKPVYDTRIYIKI